MPKILVINAGSGSQKISYFQVPNSDGFVPAADPLWQAHLDNTDPDQPPGQLALRARDEHGQTTRWLPRDLSVGDRVQKATEILRETGLPKPDAVAHRVVHGGTYDRAVVIERSVEEKIRDFSRMAPLHNPANAEAIRATQQIYRKTLHVAVFDTAFHRTLPEARKVYPGPFEWKQRGLVRYGFHGSSFRYAAERTDDLLGGQVNRRLIICHLGGGCSLAAVKDGESVDTTMGFTPLDGIAMCTRSGQVDPGILIYLMREQMDADTLEKLLNRDSGLAGLSGLAGDTRVIYPEAQKGNARARLAIDVFLHRLGQGLGAMLTSLGGLDALVFTDVIGVSEPWVRKNAAEKLSFAGITIDERLNEQNGLDRNLACRESAAAIFAVKSGEDWQIAREAALLR